jgi:two-component system, OmpR family, alkaline phosphatase synthesis response regulator PhoP
MSKIAIIEDDLNISSLIKIILSDLNLPIDIYNNGWEGLDGVLKNNYDLLVLDLMLPGINGHDICKKIRQTNTTIPILMLTAKSEDEDKINGLELGADDYLTKPFSNGELLARVKAMLRRAGKQTEITDKEHKTYRIGALVLDTEQRLLTKNNIEIPLTSKEFDLLHLLMSQAGRNFSRMDLLDRVWGDNFEGLEHTINSNINRLRIKIEDNQNEPKYLLTVWGIGYKFAKE